MYVFDCVLNAMTNPIFAVVVGGISGLVLKAPESLKTKKSNSIPKNSPWFTKNQEDFLECDRQKRSKLENILHSLDTKTKKSSTFASYKIRFIVKRKVESSGHKSISAIGKFLD